ncbi:uncharacterized protein LTHEOB_6367 [Lasiodiplodia theobromae]|uniref:uncharacterized protein n=1 Tax=Lasiodiplodia theobromae TaxID=45133 RepID=UPI0015C2CDB0|nr:uncharacterized protein LTHEOB_6367 [Lasiodiplodia theobromae]KAF4544249.1 hypothetical protein LTHEOB_6367 [Lasiodiplodia theobromae]
MQTLGIVMVVMFGLVALCLFFHFIAYTIPGWVPHEIPTRNRRRRAANRANNRSTNATRVTTRNATTTTTADGIIAPGPARAARAGMVVDGHDGPLPRLPAAAAAATLLPRSASGTTVANAAATSRPIVAAANDGSVGIQLAIVPQFVRINGGRGGGNGNSNSGNAARPAAAVPRVAGRAPPTRRAPPEYDVEAGLADPPPRYSEGLGEHDSQTVIARAA